MFRILYSKTREVFKRGSILTCGILLAIILLFPPHSQAKEQTTSEPALRAAVIVGILRFTTWPKDAQTPNFDICLAGQPLSSDHLLTLDGQHKIKGQQVHVRKVGKAKDLADCKTVILGEKINQDSFQKMEKYINTHPVISLCDGCNQSKIPNVIISLILFNQRIHFEVDWLKAKKNGVLFDSSLLELASQQKRDKS